MTMAETVAGILARGDDPWPDRYPDVACGICQFEDDPQCPGSEARLYADGSVLVDRRPWRGPPAIPPGFVWDRPPAC